MSEPTTAPVPGLLEQIVNSFKRNPKRLHMEYWGEQTACGTTGCLAGEALMLTGNAHWLKAGWRYLSHPDGSPLIGEDGKQVRYQRYSLGVVDPMRDFPDWDRSYRMIPEDSDAIERRAALLLGLDREEAHRLFHASTDEVGTVVQNLTGISWDTSSYVDNRPAPHYEESSYSASSGVWGSEDDNDGYESDEFDEGDDG